MICLQIQFRNGQFLKLFLDPELASEITYSEIYIF